MGGFREGLERNNFSCVGSVENDKFKNKIYNLVHNTEGEWHRDDIQAIKSKELPEADLYTGGFPCQSFSIAGNRGGFEETRGTLFFEIARLAKARKPKYLLLENVRGLLSHDGGRTFGTILQTLWDIGYDIQWQVLNSKDFGIPQNRERVYIVGNLRTEYRPKIFPIRKTSRTNKKKQQGDYNYTGTVKCGWGQKQNDCCMIEVEPDKWREPTPKEAFKLQGFPDEWYYKCKQAGISRAKLYQAAGDAVTVNVIEEIGRRLREN